jgi:hypothetical protein
MLLVPTPLISGKEDVTEHNLEELGNDINGWLLIFKLHFLEFNFIYFNISELRSSLGVLLLHGLHLLLLIGFHQGLVFFQNNPHMNIIFKFVSDGPLHVDQSVGFVSHSFR